MKIRTKITLLTSALVLVSLLLVLGQYLLEKERTSLFLEGIKKEEQESFNRLLDLSGSELAIFASDYSYWDDMVEYVHNPDPVFAKENIETSLTTFKASEIYVYNANRELIYGRDLDYLAVPPVFGEDLFNQLYKNRLSHFFTRKNDTLTEFRVATIHPTNDPERITEPQGLFVVGKRWDKGHLSILEELSGTTIVPSSEKAPGLRVVSLSFPYEVMDWKQEIVETFTIISSFPIVDVVQQTSKRQLLVITASSLLVLLLVYVFLHILVGRPIEALSRSIQKKDYRLMKKMQKSPSEFGILAKLVLDFSEHELVLESKAHDEAILSAVGSGLIAVDKEKKITLFNMAAERLFGITAEKALGLRIDEVFQAETEEGASLAGDEFPLTRALGTKKLISETILCVRPDGMKFSAVVTATPIVLYGEIIGAVQDLRDITAEKTLERSKRDFISLVSHELRTPLTNLTWTVEQLESAKNISASTSIPESTVPYMRSALNRIRTLVSAIVDVSKIENGSIVAASKVLKFSSLLALSLEDLKLAIKAKNLTVTINEETSGNDLVKSDERMLEIIVNNLVSNAVRYSNENGQIRITTRKEESELVVGIVNTGPGIPKEEQTQIFSKMFRATNAKLLSPDGIGLGLYISKSFLELLGGSISFTSIPDQETVFTIRLPHGLQSSGKQV